MKSTTAKPRAREYKLPTPPVSPLWVDKLAIKAVTTSDPAKGLSVIGGGIIGPITQKYSYGFSHDI